MDKQTESRSQFEAAWEEVHGVPAVPWESLRKDNFEYKALHLTAAWRWWRRSRESLVVAMPDCDDYDATWQYQDACEERLRAIGIRIKGEGDGASS